MAAYGAPMAKPVKAVTPRKGAIVLRAGPRIARRAARRLCTDGRSLAGRTTVRAAAGAWRRSARHRGLLRFGRTRGRNVRVRRLNGAGRNRKHPRLRPIDVPLTEDGTSDVQRSRRSDAVNTEDTTETPNPHGAQAAHPTGGRLDGRCGTSRRGRRGVLGFVRVQRRGLRRGRRAEKTRRHWRSTDTPAAARSPPGSPTRRVRSTARWRSCRRARLRAGVPPPRARSREVGGTTGEGTGCGRKGPVGGQHLEGRRADAGCP